MKKKYFTQMLFVLFTLLFFIHSGISISQPINDPPITTIINKNKIPNIKTPKQKILVRGKVIIPVQYPPSFYQDQRLWNRLDLFFAQHRMLLMNIPGFCNKPACVLSDDGSWSCVATNGYYEIEVEVGDRTLVYDVPYYKTKSQQVTVTLQTTQLPDMYFSNPNDQAATQQAIYGSIEGYNRDCVKIYLYKLECGSWVLNKKVQACNGGQFSFGQAPNGTYKIVPQITSGCCSPVDIQVTIQEGQNQSPTQPPYVFNKSC